MCPKITITKTTHTLITFKTQPETLECKIWIKIFENIAFFVLLNDENWSMKRLIERFIEFSDKEVLLLYRKWNLRPMKLRFNKKKLDCRASPSDYNKNNKKHRIEAWKEWKSDYRYLYWLSPFYLFFLYCCCVGFFFRNAITNWLVLLNLCIYGFFCIFVLYIVALESQVSLSLLFISSLKFRFSFVFLFLFCLFIK